MYTITTVDVAFGLCGSSEDLRFDEYITPPKAGHCSFSSISFS